MKPVLKIEQIMKIKKVRAHFICFFFSLYLFAQKHMIDKSCEAVYFKGNDFMKLAAKGFCSCQIKCNICLNSYSSWLWPVFLAPVPACLKIKEAMPETLMKRRIERSLPSIWPLIAMS